MKYRVTVRQVFERTGQVVVDVQDELDADTVAERLALLGQIEWGPLEQRVPEATDVEPVGEEVS